LKNHIQMVHENKKPYKCNLCEYSSFFHNDLRRHIECVHEKIKQHQCNICQKVLVVKELLRIIFKWFMKTRRNTNKNCLSIHSYYTIV
jgi:uncharacterized Zn-finger protein